MVVPPVCRARQIHHALEQALVQRGHHSYLLDGATSAPRAERKASKLFEAGRDENIRRRG